MSRPDPSQNGFSLVEVLVALFVFATAGISLMTLNQGSVTASRDLENRYLARIVADNRLIDVFTDPLVLERGVETGQVTQMGRTFTWLRTISDSPTEGLVILDVQVSLDGSETVLAQASSLKAIAP